MWDAAFRHGRLQNRRIDVIRQIEKADAKTMAMVLPRISFGMVRLNMLTSSWPLIRFQIMTRRSAKLVVLMPPPVESGRCSDEHEDDQNEDGRIGQLTMSTVLKPAGPRPQRTERRRSESAFHGRSLAECDSFQKGKTAKPLPMIRIRGHHQDNPAVDGQFLL